MKRSTLEELAKKADVSKTTAFRVVNGRDHVSEKLRKRVLKVMQELGISKPQALLVGLVVPNSSNPYFSMLCFKFEQVLWEKGMHVLISSSEERSDRELAIVERFRDLGVDGLIYIPTGEGSEMILNLVARGDLPTIVFDRKVRGQSLDFVATDSRHGTQCAVDYLVAHGHTRIGYIKGQRGTRTAQDRYTSFCDAVKQNELHVDPKWVQEGDYSIAAGTAYAEMLLQLPGNETPTAVMAANDLMAIGLMHKLQSEGWSLPLDLSVIGFDNIELSQWVHPSLTTIEQPINQLVEDAARLLKRRIEAGTMTYATTIATQSHEFKPLLIPRSSVTSPRSLRGGPKLVEIQHYVHDSGSAIDHS